MRDKKLEKLGKILGLERVEILAQWLYEYTGITLGVSNNWRYARKIVKNRYRDLAGRVLSVLDKGEMPE